MLAALYVIHGLCFELSDGMRLGQFLEDDKQAMDLEDDAGLIRRDAQWTDIEEDEWIEHIDGQSSTL